jgi:hypothetical protein
MVNSMKETSKTTKEMAEALTTSETETFMKENS